MTKKAPTDFVTWLQGQRNAFRARRFEELDVAVLSDELEGVVGRHRREVGDRAERLIANRLGWECFMAMASERRTAFLGSCQS
jgi:hypothetical protein